MILLVHEFFLLVTFTDFMLFSMIFSLPSFITMLFLRVRRSFCSNVDLFFSYKSSISRLLFCKIFKILFFSLSLSLCDLFLPFNELTVVLISLSSLVYFFSGSDTMYLNLFSLIEAANGSCIEEIYSIILDIEHY